MNKSWFYLGAIGSLAILTTSCGDSKPAASPAASPSAIASPAASPVAAVPTKTTPAPTATTTPTSTVATGIPTVPGKKSVSVDVAAGLIAPTNGDNWAKTVLKGRADPFAALVLQPIEVTEKDPLNPAGKPQKASSTIASNNRPTIKSGVNKPLPGIKTGTKIASTGLNPTNRAKSPSSYVPISAIPRSGVNKALPKIVIDLRPGRSAQIIGMPRVVVATRSVPAPASKRPSLTGVPGTTQITAKPARVAEKPLQAIALEISGVIEVEGRTQVIVKLPGESSSQYIEVGSRVANSRVLIKRVDGQNSLSPTVVLEEVGVEVPRKVGDKSASINLESVPKSAPIISESLPQPVPVNPEFIPKP